MTLGLKDIINEVFKNKYERTTSNEELKPLFYRFIGVKDQNEYDDVLKTLQSKCLQHKDVSIIFDNELPFKPEMDLINYIYYELGNMNITSMKTQDIVVFKNENINNKFLEALDYVINIARQKENFFSENVLKNFITKLIVWAYTYGKDINFESDYNPKCIYYGNIERHAVYFLIILYLIGFDVLYINPLKEEYFEDIEQSKLSIKVQNMAIVSLDSFKEHAKRGKEIENIETVAKKLEKEVTSQFFEGTGMYAPWQFRDGYTKAVLLDGILEDILIYWNEPAKLRDGFRVDKNVVTVPCLFKKISGVYNDLFEYQKLIKKCIETENTLVFNNNNISTEIKFSEDMYELMFCQLSDGTFDIAQVKKSKFYKFQKFSDEVQNLLLNKFNETIKSKDVFANAFDKKACLELLCLVLSLNEDIVKLIDNFDFTSNIPKIVIFLDEENTLSEQMIKLLAYLHLIGLDIVVFNPSGSLNFNLILMKEVYTEDRLESMKYDISFKKVMSLKKGFFSKLFDM